MMKTHESWFIIKRNSLISSSDSMKEMGSMDTFFLKIQVLLLIMMSAVLSVPSVSIAADTITQITSTGNPKNNPQINANGWITWEGLPYPWTDTEIFLYNGTTITQLTDNSIEDYYPQINDNGWVTWEGGTNYDNMEIFLYNGTTITQLTNNSYYDWYPQINNNGWVTWEGYDGTDTEIFLYNGTTIKQLTNNSDNDMCPQINSSGWITWYGSDYQDDYHDLEIFLYNGTAVTQLTNNFDHDFYPQINDNGWITWWAPGGYGPNSNDNEIFFYNGTTVTQLTNNSIEDYYPQINANGWVTWYGGDRAGNYDDIFLYNGTTIIQLTNNSYEAWLPQINDSGWVTWEGSDGTDDEIFLYNGTTVTQLTNNGINDNRPQINANGWVSWEAYQIFLAKPNINNTPKKIYGLFIGIQHEDILMRDFDGGFSAQLMRDTFLNFPNVGDAVLIKTNKISKNEIQQAVGRLRDKMDDNDIFFLYITSHGGSGSDADNGGETTLSSEDEYVKINEDSAFLNDPDSYLTDDNLLYDLLMEDMNGVSKWIFVDFCHSGGFWGNGVETSGDIERLSNIAFLATSQENTTTHAYKTNQFPKAGPIALGALGFYWGFGKNTNGQYFKPEFYLDGRITFDEISSYLQYLVDHHSEIKGEVVVEMAAGDEHVFSEDMWTPKFEKSDNFDGDFPVSDVNILTAEAGGPYSGKTDMSVSIDASASYSPDGAIYSYSWDWDNDDAYDEETTSPVITHTWNSPFSGYVRVKITNTEGKFSEDIASVNILKLEDLDEDGDVDIVDIMKVAARWNTSTGDPNYDVPCDLDGDGDIDIIDIMKVAAQWGWSG